MNRLQRAVIAFLAMSGLAFSKTASVPVAFPSRVPFENVRGVARPLASPVRRASPEATPIFGGYNNATWALTAVAGDGNGQYAEVGTTGLQAYLGIYNSADHTQVCETTFVPLDNYDQGHALGVAFGSGVVYVAGEAHDTTSSPDDFDAFVQRFDPTNCEKVGGVVIEGDIEHDAFTSVAVSAAGVIAAGYIHVRGDDQFLAERWSADLSNNVYRFYYPIGDTAGGNRTNAVVSDDDGNAWLFGFLRFTPAGVDQRLEYHALAPDGSVVGTVVFYNSDSGPSQYTSVRRGIDGLIYSGGTIVDTRLAGGPGPFAFFEAGRSADLSSLNCSVFFQNTISSSGMDIDLGNPAIASPTPNLYGVVVFDPATAPPLPEGITRLHGTDCTTTEPILSFGSADGIDTPGGVGYDTSTNTGRHAAATTGSIYVPNTDGSMLTPPQNGYLSEFGNFLF